MYINFVKRKTGGFWPLVDFSPFLQFFIYFFTQKNIVEKIECPLK